MGKIPLQKDFGIPDAREFLIKIETAMVPFS